MMHDCAFETETQEPKDHLIDILLCNGPLRVPTHTSQSPIVASFSGAVYLFYLGLSMALLGIMNFPLYQRDGVENIIHCHISGIAHALVDVRGVLGWES